MSAKKVTKVELLTTEFHPITGRLERWRMSDGSIQEFTSKTDNQA